MLKKLLFAFCLVLIFSGLATAQLGNIVITSAPCDCYPGQSSVMTATAVPGAAYYEWELDTGHINTVWFNWTPGPVQTTTPSVNISCQLPSQFIIICVTAYNVTDSSNRACVSIWNNVDPPVLSASNSTIGIPGDSGMYAVDPPASCPPVAYVWTITGDASFSNNTQTITTQTSGPPVNVNFGPFFTTGILCVYAVSAIGFPSDTVCMTITAPVGINDISNSQVSFYHQAGMQQIALVFSKLGNRDIAVAMYDLAGRMIIKQQSYSIQNQEELFISTQGLGKGIYFAEVNGNNYRKVFKFAITR